MPRHSENRHLPYEAGQIWQLVADVARYPEFLPWTGAARIRSRLPLPDRGPGAETDYLDGPFRYLHSYWQIDPDPSGGCQVRFEVDFEFRNRMLQAVIGVVFDEAMRRVVRAFERRAADLYGPPDGVAPI